MANVAAPSAAAVEKKKKLDSSFFKKGVFTAIISGIAYGFYTAFMTLGMAKGVWADHFYADPATSATGVALSAFVVTYLLGSLGSALNDTCSGIWCVIIALVKGKFGDYVKTLLTQEQAASLSYAPSSEVLFQVLLTLSDFSWQALSPFLYRHCARQ